MMIDRLLAKGGMPRLRRLLEAGSRADLRSSLPRLSPLLWSTIATGRTPDRHGILNFIEPDPDPGSTLGVRLASSTSRRVKAIWNMLTQSGLRVHVVGWYASHPAEPISGICVSNMLQEGEPASVTAAWPLAPGTVHPVEVADVVAGCRVHSSTVAREQLLALVPKLREVEPNDPRIKTLMQQLARTASVHRAARTVIEYDRHWDCTMVFYEGIDTIGHHFMQYFPPQMPHVSREDLRRFGAVMPGTYELHDRMLGELLDRAPADTTVLLLSDHGFHSDHRRPAITAELAADRAALEASWHREFGVLVLSGPGVGKDSPIVAPGLCDIAPTALSLLGLPVAHDLDGRPLVEAFVPPVAAEDLEWIESWENRPGEAGQHPPDLQLDPFEARDALRQLVDLGYLAEMPSDLSERVELVRRETNFNLAITHLEKREPSRAAELLQALAMEHPAEPRYVESLARALREGGRAAEAVAPLQALMASNPERIETRLQLAAAMHAAGDAAGAVREFTRAREEASDRGELQLGLGTLATALGRFDQATAHLAEAKKHDLTPSVHLAFARLALLRGRHEPAAEHALDALDLAPAAGEGNFLLGAALAWLGSIADARRCFELALAREPGRVEAAKFLIALDESEGLDEAAAARRQELEQRLARSGGAAAEEPPFGATAWTAARRSGSSSAADA